MRYNKFIIIISILVFLIITVCVYKRNQVKILDLDKKYISCQYKVSILEDRLNCIEIEKSVINKLFPNVILRSADSQTIELSNVVGQQGAIIVRMTPSSCMDCVLGDIDKILFRVGKTKAKLLFIFSDQQKRILRTDYFKGISDVIYLYNKEIDFFDKLSKPYIVELDNKLKVLNMFILSDSRKEQKRRYYENL